MNETSKASSSDNTHEIITSGQTVTRTSGDVALCWLAVLAVLYTLYFTRSLLLPIILALLFSLLLSPLVRYLKTLHIPRTLSALVLLTCIGVPVGLLGTELSVPAQRWMERLPELGMQVSKELDEFSDSFAAPVAQEIAEVETKEEEDEGFSFFGLFKRDEPEPPKPVPEENTPSPVTEKLVQGSLEVALSVLGATPVFLAQFLTFIILVLFQLVFGQQLFLHAIDTIPRNKDKRRVTLIVSRIQRELSRYILTVSIINTGLGIATAFTLALLGVQDALLWGALVGLLNFAPYVGPALAILVLAMAGLVQYGFELLALMPAAAFFALNLLESQVVTPLVLGRHMRLNPLVLVIWVVVWAWLWGAMGVLLSVPLLVCLKLAAQQLGILDYWVALIEAGSSVSSEPTSDLNH